jgi:hypothetical protein
VKKKTDWKSRALRAEDELADWKNSVKGAMEIRCEEKHCSCVPVLVARVKELERALQRAEDCIAGACV